MKVKKIIQENMLIATALMIVVVAAFFVVAYFQIGTLVENRSLRRMEEGINTATQEITNKLNRDSQILNATADILSNAGEFDVKTVQETMSAVAPLLQTMRVRILLPDNTIIEENGKTLDGNGSISFDELSKLGEHVSNRMTSIIDGNTLVLRHYVPIEKNGKVVAVLFGVTKLSELPEIMNIDNIYNASASVYIFDTSNGDIIMDTYEDNMGKIQDMKVDGIKNGDDWDETVQDLLDEQRGYVVIRLNGFDEWMYFYYTPAGINQWSIAISVPEAEALKNLYAIQHIFTILASLTAIAAAIYYLWVFWNTKRAMERAVEKAVLEEKLQKAETAERAKTMFLSNMSHDIRTPMNAIIGFTTLAKTNIDNKGRVEEYLSKILSSSNHLLSLINDVLDMSRIESGRLNIEEKECNISDIFKDMRNILQTQMASKQLNFFMDTVDVVDEDIYCDKLHINQVLLNLLGNAIKFTPNGGTVSLTIQQTDGALAGYGAYEIRVKDTGIGMSKEFAERIFEPFEREQTSTVSGIQGTGLGMAIAKSIVEEMGGTIRVETEKGKGTEFIINLEFRLASERKQIEVVPELKGLRTLVVDDNFMTCDSVSKMLLQIGMRAEWTLYGKEAILRAKQAIEMGDDFYVYLVDWALPDLGGLEVVRQIRAEVGEDIPIIILTAYDWTLIEKEAREAGVTAFCNKPLFISDLRDTLVAVVKETKESDRTEKAQAGETIIPSATDSLQGKRLLLVEDIELNRELAQEILQESGFKVETAENGQIAVDMVRNSNPGDYDLVLMDVQMPVMNGYDATKAIRSLDNSKLASIPIIAMTANAFEEDKKKAFESGMDAHIAKPIDVKILVEVIHSVLAS